MAVDMFLKIDGIGGESIDTIHKDWIDISSFSWGETNAGAAAGGAGAGKVAIQDFHFTKAIDKASPLLMLACASGLHMQKAQLVCRKAGTNPVEFLTVTIENCLLSSFAFTEHSGGNPAPAESITINFTKIEMIYKSPRDGVVIEGDFDFSQTTP